VGSKPVLSERLQPMQSRARDESDLGRFASPRGPSQGLIGGQAADALGATECMVSVILNGYGTCLPGSGNVVGSKYPQRTVRWGKPSPGRHPFFISARPETGRRRREQNLCTHRSCHRKADLRESCARSVASNSASTPRSEARNRIFQNDLGATLLRHRSAWSWPWRSL